MTIAASTLSFAARFLPQRAIDNIIKSPSKSARAIGLLDRFAPTGDDEVVFVGTGPIAGLRMRLEPKRQKYFWMGTFEPWVQEALRRHWRSPMQMWDIGAFVGYHTLVMRQLAGPNCVLAIEPDPASFKKLKQNLELNGFGDVRTLPLVIGEKRGRASLQIIKDGPSMTSARPADDGEVAMVSLDDLLELEKAPGLIKMDIEGAEAGALRGAPRMLTHVRPVWVLEMHGTAGEDAVEQLRAANYRISKLDAWNSFAAELIGGGASHVLAEPK